MEEKKDKGTSGATGSAGRPGNGRGYGKRAEGNQNGRAGAAGKPGAGRGYGKRADGIQHRRSGDSGAAGKPGAGRGYEKNAGEKTGGKPGTRGGYGKGPEEKAGGTRGAFRSGGKPEARKSFEQDRKPGERSAQGPRGPYGKPAPKRTENRVGPQAPEGMASRRIALKVLREVIEEGAYASLALDKALQGGGLNAADRRLVSRLVYDTLDHLEYLDWMLSQVMAREDTDIKLRNILRLGACQLLVEDRIPESAATNTSVQLCEDLKMEGLKGVCNGILRNLIRKKEELTLPDPETEPEKYFAVKYSLPQWLGTRLKRDWGEEEAVSIASWRNTDSTVTIRRNLIKTDEKGFRAILEKKIWGREPGTLADAWKITGAMDLARDTDFLAGHFSIQSESSMMACLAVAPGRGMRILDCCAAPGGKSCYLSELMGDTGRIQAWDLHDHRVQLIAAQQRRLGLENIRPIQRDAAVYRESLEASMDAVLLDAPCSGLGVLAEKPDIKLRVTEESVAELTALQAKLLETVCRYVRPGGTLVYSTCSLLKEENENQVRAFLERHPEFEAEKLPETIPEKFRRYEQLGLQLLPHRDGTEGFYICRMRRKEDA